MKTLRRVAFSVILLAMASGTCAVLAPADLQAMLHSAGEQLQEASATLPPSATTISAQGTIEVSFSPPLGTTEVVIRAMNEAQRRLWIQAYSFTSAPIAKAALAAQKRGVEVRVLLDKSQRTQKYSEADFFANQGVDIRIDDQHAIAHNKVMVIDDATVITGSFNFTKAAEQANAENLLVLRGNPALNALYAQNFLHHWSHSTPYSPRHGLD
ncbi:phospholipase D family protein [Acidithiobacillus sp. AMEEHan]|uniref:phospholipase D family nuclease n=1 Tax=Acidithiobacillus sp. AMEEHan TaxID=2994951 RepID=UPI0027E41A13|nr:phospholipase D family protein [Acidithiobacillus sp. AMEEHan]